MDFSTLLILGALWLVFNVLTRAKGTGQPPPGRGPVPLPRQPAPPARSSPPRSGPPPAAARGADPTQREGSRLESLLRDLNRSLEEAARAASADEGESDEAARAGASGRSAKTVGRPSRPPVAGETPAPPLAETVEAVSLEQEVRRPERPRVAQDDLAGQVVARRIAAGEARSGALTGAGHAKFDKRIRQEPADHTAVRRRYTPQQLRDAIMWREILGPPVGMRDLEGGGAP